jgi:sigma-B regulation protein RsbU (phosphoserine phosphatase)
MGPMPRPKPLLVVLAFLFAGVTTAYSVVWLVLIRREQTSLMGLTDVVPAPAEAALEVRRVREGGAAARAGVRSGDHVVAVNGRPLDTLRPLAEVLYGGPPGAVVELRIRRESELSPFTVRLVTDAPGRISARSLSEHIVDELLKSYPVLFLVVSMPVLLLRPHDRNAWLLALLFATFIAATPYLELATPESLKGFVLAYRILFNGLSGSLFLYFFAVFPAPSTLDRRFPWLKTLWLGVAAACALPLATWAFVAGDTPAISVLRQGLDVFTSPYVLAAHAFGLTGYVLGFVSLVGNARSPEATVRRKSRVILWGTLAGVGPSLFLSAAAAVLHTPIWEFPFWCWAPVAIATFLMPLAFAYAVVRHQVLEIPVLLRRGARYLLVQRGFLVLLVLLGIAATGLFAHALGALLGPGMETAAVSVGTGFGTLLIVTGSRVQRRVRERVDRAFFRSAYDARQILQDLAERARGATSRDDLAGLLEQHVTSALFPSSLVVYVEAREGVLERARGSVPAGWETLPATLPPLADLARRGQPRNADDSDAFDAVAPLRPDCLVPILGRDGRLAGLLVLGPRLSEEPYSREDRRLLASVASQAGITLDSVQLAERMAARLEAERLERHEMELARQVQSRLLPQEPLRLATAACAGQCVQARAVGGDYYDFLDLGSGRVGLALADVSGKGFPAALLAASLQASLRSRLPQDMLDLPRLLRSVNQLLYRSSEVNRYATLFLGIYEDATRRFSYANCGHNPPILLRADGTVDRLPPTGPALGIFEDWECESAEAALCHGDLLAIFSDGVTEAWNDAGEEFGEARLIEVLWESRHRTVDAIVDQVLDTVVRFSGSEQEDDQTLLVARGL